MYFVDRGVLLKVYLLSTSDRGCPLLFDGTISVSAGNAKHTLHIMYYEVSRHYQPILNLIEAIGTHRNCNHCSKRYYHGNNAAPQKKKKKKKILCIGLRYIGIFMFLGSMNLNPGSVDLDLTPSDQGHSHLEVISRQSG